jgi:hypothetical protein
VLERPFIGYAFVGAIASGVLTGLVARLAVARRDQDRVETMGMLFGAGLGLFLAAGGTGA